MGMVTQVQILNNVGWLGSMVYQPVTRPKILIPKRVYFSHVGRRGSLALDPLQNKFQLRFPFGRRETGRLCWG